MRLVAAALVAAGSVVSAAQAAPRADIDAAYSKPRDMDPILGRRL